MSARNPGQDIDESPKRREGAVVQSFTNILRLPDMCSWKLTASATVGSINVILPIMAEPPSLLTFVYIHKYIFTQPRHALLYVTGQLNPKAQLPRQLFAHDKPAHLESLLPILETS